MSREPIQTPRAPAAIGTYSQAIRAGDMVFLSGQIPLDPNSGLLVEGDVTEQTRQVFTNLRAVCEAAGGSLADIVRIGVYLADLKDFPALNTVMESFFEAPFPARSTIEVSALPRGARVEVDAIMVLR